jgi:hypothetical protein
MPETGGRGRRDLGREVGRRAFGSKELEGRGLPQFVQLIEFLPHLWMHPDSRNQSPNILWTRDLTILHGYTYFFYFQEGRGAHDALFIWSGR